VYQSPVYNPGGGMTSPGMEPPGGWVESAPGARPMNPMPPSQPGRVIPYNPAGSGAGGWGYGGGPMQMPAPPMTTTVYTPPMRRADQSPSEIRQRQNVYQPPMASGMDRYRGYGAQSAPFR